MPFGMRYTMFDSPLYITELAIVQLEFISLRRSEKHVSRNR